MDTDAAGIYHNSAVIRYVEAAEADLARSRGLPTYFSVAPRVRYEVDFEAALRFGDAFECFVEVERSGTSSITFAFQLWALPTPDRETFRVAAGRYVVVHITGGHADEGGPSSSPWPRGWVEKLTSDR